MSFYVNFEHVVKNDFVYLFHCNLLPGSPVSKVLFNVNNKYPGNTPKVLALLSILLILNRYLPICTYFICNWIPHSVLQYLEPFRAAFTHAGPKHCLSETVFSRSFSLRDDLVTRLVPSLSNSLKMLGCFDFLAFSFSILLLFLRFLFLSFLLFGFCDCSF